MMNPEFKAKWVAALRSGEYKQCKNSLRQEDGFCCLGVACDISGLGSWTSNMSTTDYLYAVEDEREESRLTSTIVDYMGVAKSFDRVGYIPFYTDRDGNRVALTILNDEGCTFDQIADIIEYFF